jgi:sugar lactone lactonase YvrE
MQEKSGGKSANQKITGKNIIAIIHVPDTTTPALADLRMILSLVRSLLLLVLLTPFSQAETLFVSYVGGQIGRFDSVTGANLGLFASGLHSPRGLTFDSTGNLYVANVNSATINKITPDGTVSAFASGGGLDFPYALAVDVSGSLYASNLGNNTISRIAPDGTVSLFATGMNRAHGLTFGSDGNLYASNYEDATVLKIDAAGTTSLFAVGNGMSNPVGIAAVGSNLFVANARNDTISLLDSTGSVSLFAAGGGLSFPVGLAADSAGNLFAANFNGYNISKITPSGAVQFFVNTDGGPAAMAFAPTLPPVVVPEPNSAILAIIGGIGCTILFRPRRR